MVTGGPLRQPQSEPENGKNVIVVDILRFEKNDSMLSSEIVVFK